MVWFIGILLTVVGLVILLALLHDNSPVERTPDEISHILEAWLKDKIDWREWDYFESCDIKNPELNQIKEECMKIDMPNSKYLSDHESKILNPEGKKIVETLLARCKNIA